MSNINDTLKRINELAAKKKSGQQLTPEELAEKKELYEIYLASFEAKLQIHWTVLNLWIQKQVNELRLNKL